MVKSMAEKYKVLQPVYFRDFQCSASECEEICCRSWNIVIDEKTYHLYQNCPDAELREKMAENIILNQNNSDNSYYAKIKLNETDKVCPFLTEEKLCGIQRKLGEEYLSIICASYPRVYNLVDDVLEKSLTLSCIEAARLVLLNPAPIKFELTEQDIDINRHLILETISSKVVISKHDQLKQYFEIIRTFNVSVLQNRHYPLWQRMVVLGLFYSKLDKLVKYNLGDEVFNLIKTYQTHMEKGNLSGTLENIQDNLVVRLKILYCLIENTSSHANDDIFLEQIEQALQGLNYSTGSPENENMSGYELAYKKYYQPVASKHEYILEHYLVNYTFIRTFPFTLQRDFFASYMILAIEYAIIKLLLIGIAGFYKEEFNTGHMVELIKSFSKNITHDSKWLLSIFDFLKDNNLDNLAYMSILIKN